MNRQVFVGATLIDGVSGAGRHGITTVVEAGRITAVTRDQDAPAPEPNDQVFDATGLTVMPGMFQCHLHAAMDDVTGYLELDMKYPSEYLTLIAARNANSLLRSGFTSAIGAGSPANIDVVLKHAINEGLIPGPRFTACGRHLCTSGESLDFHPGFWKSRLLGFGHPCNGPDEFRKVVRTEIKDGVDIVKVHVTGGHGSNYPLDVMPITAEELGAATGAAHERGKKIRAHASNKKGILAAVGAGVDLIDHVDRLDDECIEAFLEHGTAITAGAYITSRYIALVTARRQRSSEDSPPPNPVSSPFHSHSASSLEVAQRTMEHYQTFLPKAVKAGVKLLLGDDAGSAGIFPHGAYADELACYVNEVGISSADVLAMATRTPAQFLGQSSLGAIASGNVADLLVVKGNPLDDITVLQDRANLMAIMKGGVFVRCQLTNGLR